MADKNQLKRVDPVDFGDDDPFEELTKIMGFDPRSPGRPGAGAASARADASDDTGTASEQVGQVFDADFDIDLEKELMSDLPVGDDAPADEAAVHAEPAVEDAAPAGDFDNFDVDDLGLDEAFDHVLAGADLHDDDAATASEAAAVGAEPETEPMMEAAAGEPLAKTDDIVADDVDADIGEASESELDDELSLAAHETVDTPAAESAGQETAALAEQDIVGDIELDLADEQDAGEQDAGEARLDEPASTAVEEPRAAMDDPLFDLEEFAGPRENEAAGEPEMAEDGAETDVQAADGDDVAAAPESHEPAAAAPMDEIDADFDAAMADVDMDFSAGLAAESYHDDAPVGEPEELDAPMTASNYPAAAMPDDVSPTADGTPVAETINLEDELSALLGNSLPRTEFAGGYETSPLNLHARADAASSDRDVEPVADYRDGYAGASYAATDSDVHDDQPEAADADYDANSADVAGAGHETAAQADLEPEFDDSHFQAAFDTSLDAHIGAGGGDVHSAGEENPFDALQEMAAAREKADSARSRVFQMLSGASTPAEESAASLPDDRPAQATDRAMPDIETVEVPEGAIAIEDDLDIPELDYQEEPVPAAPFDEFESDFVSAYQDIAQPERAGPATAAAGVAGFAQSYSRGPAAAIGWRQSDATHVAAPEAVDDDAFADEFDVDLFDAMAADEEFANGPEAIHDQAGTVADADADPFQVADVPPFVAERPVRRGRGFMIAGIVLGVAVLGGVGAFALSFGDDGGSVVPAVVKADAGPIKVRPKNPGGTTVPNQDSKVYETVATGERPSLPEQKTLITTSEEPVDVAAQATETRVVTPPKAVSAGADPIAEKITSKGEDRLPPSTETASVPQDTGVAAVAPRRVRTMVVRPDGTLVPREESESRTASLSAEPEAGADAMPIEPAKTAEASVDGAATASAAETTGSTTQSTDAGIKAAELANLPTAVSKVVPKPSVMPNEVALAPSRPADQPVDIVGEVKPDRPNPSSSAAAAGPWSVQIASQPSEEAAKASYQNLSRRYAGVIGDKGVTIVKADIAGKGTYWRVRIPAGDRNSAINLCESYKSAGGNCFVSK